MYGTDTYTHTYIHTYIRRQTIDVMFLMFSEISHEDYFFSGFLTLNFASLAPCSMKIN